MVDPDVTIPKALADQIHDGNCVAFVGAGFSAAAGLPGWGTLLAMLAARPAVTPQLREHVARLCEQPSAHRLDQAAQLLQDALGRKDFIAGLKDVLGRPDLTPQMEQRCRLLREIPFRAVLTLNFDPLLEGALPSPAVYGKILRPRPSRWWNQVFRGNERGAPVVKLHGDLERSPIESIVVTRRDYRRRLYTDAAYLSFLRSLFAHCAVLFLGVSFEDAYLNELRSETLSMLGFRRGQRPVAWAVMNDCDPTTTAFFEDHEGIGMLGYDTRGGTDYSGFDRYLEALHDATHPVPYLSRVLGERRILWMDAEPDNNLPGLRFLRRAAGPSASHPDRFVQVETVDEALAALGAPDGGDCPFSLVISHWGGPAAHAVTLLERMRAEDLRCPVIVFSSSYAADERKRTLQGLGAQAHCFRWESLFREIQRVFEPADVTG